MFRKGIVTFFDEGLGTGVIALNTDHQEVGFKIENFSSGSLLPQVGERVKCIILEQQGELSAKCIVRLDYKNYTGAKRVRTSVMHSQEENWFENMQTVRKMLKKRRLNVENELLDSEDQDSNAQVDQLNLADTIEHIQSIHSPEIDKNTQSIKINDANQFAEDKTKGSPKVKKSQRNQKTQRRLKVQKDKKILKIQTIDHPDPPVETINDPMKKGEGDEPIAKIHNDEVTVHREEIAIESSPLIYSDEAINAHSDLCKEGVESLKVIELNDNSSPTAPIDTIHHSESTNTHVEANADNVQQTTVNEVIESSSNMQNTDIPEIDPKLGSIEKNQNIDLLNKQVVGKLESTQKKNIDELLESEHTVQDSENVTEIAQSVKVDSINEQVLIETSEKNQQLLEKSMNLNNFQRLIQAIKVKFLYSKRKQAPKVIGEKKSFYLNPSYLIIGIVLVLCMGSLKYAFDRFERYKAENAFKLQQYQKLQIEVIKKQKNETRVR